MIDRMVALGTRRPRIVVLTALLTMLAAGLFAATHFAMTTDTGVLISPQVEWRKQEAAANAAFPQFADASLVVIDGATPEAAEAAAATLTEAMAADTAHFRSARRPDGGGFFATHGLLFGSEAEVRAATSSLIDAQPLLGPLAADPSLRGIAGALDTVLLGVERGDAKLATLDKPMGQLADPIEATLAGRPAQFSWQRLVGTGSGTLAPPTRQLILFQPVLDYTALKPGEKASRAIAVAARNAGLDASRGVTVRITGAVPLSDEEFSSLEENIGLVGLLMALAMVTTLWFATRSIGIVAAIVVTTLAGLVTTTAIGLLVVGELNLISVAFIPLFVGLGVDFGIQIAVRFNAERQAGADFAEALGNAASALGGPLMLAAGAVFLGFGAFLPTAYVGIAELGIISGIGMVIALLFSVILLPALLMLIKPAAPREEVGFTGAAPVDRFLARRRRGVLWAFGLSMIGSIALLPLVTFDFNPFHLRDPGAPAMRTLSDLMHDPLRTPNTIDVIVKDAETASALARRLAALPEVAQAITLDSFIPADQPAKLAVIEDAALLLDLSLNPFDIAPPASDAETIAALTATAARLRAVGGGADGGAARRLAAAFEKLAAATPETRAQAERVLVEPLTVMLSQASAALQASEITRETLPPEIARDWLTPDGRARVQVFPKGDSNDNRVLARFTAAVQKVAPSATGLPVSTQAAAGTIAGAFVQAGLIALVLVSLLLLAVLRDLREVAFTLAPVVLSGFLTLGTCVLIGQSINFANIIAFPLLFGVGVAFHIYFVMAWRVGARDLLQSSLARAVLFSALATGSAFGALWISQHPGTASMGKILMLSLAWTLVCALIFEPALLGPPKAAKRAE
ncbi:MMPL family transporter [Novosphingobium sp.]|uniref:MMPL family transporter n=1 Tax=Novosphingobium sp. TaxID=1874826 RepID=UPI001D8BBCBB|nr:MMPL family transporter [Novosphingobium sp.]MBX9664741.1 MMPL family transporter [Novosphingobium sp.]